MKTQPVPSTASPAPGTNAKLAARNPIRLIVFLELRGNAAAVNPSLSTGRTEARSQELAESYLQEQELKLGDLQG